MAARGDVLEGGTIAINPANKFGGVMKHLLILTVGISLLISMPVMADQAADEVAIRKTMEQLYAAYNNHDAKAYAAHCDEIIENWDGSDKGRAAFEKTAAKFLERQKDYHVKPLEEIGIVFVTPDVAIYKVRDEMSGELDAAGKALPPFKMIRARVLVKKNGKWLYAATFSRRIEE